MNRKFVLFSLAIVLVFAFASVNAASSDKSLEKSSNKTTKPSDNYIFENVKKFVDEKYNPRVGNMSGYAKSFLKNERIELQVENKKIGLVTKNAKIIEVIDGDMKKPTVRVTMKRNAFDRIIISNDPVSALKSGLKKGDIKVKGVGVLKWMKFSLSNLATITGRVLGV